MGFGGNITNIIIVAATLNTSVAIAIPFPISAQVSCCSPIRKMSNDRIHDKSAGVTHGFVYGNIIYAIDVY
jgi:hypothetical protein